MNSISEVTLSPAEISLCVCIAAQRIATKKPTDRFIASGITPFASHLIGVMGEFAVGRIHGGKINQAVLPNGDRHCHDMTVRGGKHVEVKASTFPGKDIELKLHPEELKPELWFALVRVRMPDSADVFPLISSSEARFLGAVKNYGYGERLAITGDAILEHCANAEV